ncbi:PP2C family protein-serine/threonine phosphatase [Allostreptomyces psammosilenae]|uniref:Serine/threonine protein phosphatase PstP n=1 Tax=Allostreptomyces psammosilenae TaxID=1892865 RepID=A0A852ZU20_9ACTN|nr:PP2C family serine/threonine-protein phosphatase [Allostreptomyces psammosilenae]NYI05375.1 protein phosphatase [Allostreptomyces psammosilenae]
MTLTLRFAAGSHKGMIREGNEDSGYAGPRLLAVADGMGGQAAGEVASSAVLSTLVDLDEDVPGADLLSLLENAVHRANDHLRAMVEEDPQLEGMGTTLTALLWSGNRLGLVHVGDSRAYLLRDGVLDQITQDHTWVQRLVDEGRITEEEAGTHPQRSLLMRALDGRGQVEPDLSIREVRLGDRYLICSDGLSGVVSAETLQETLLAYAQPADAIAELISLALRGGGPDNITCVVADVIDIDGPDALATPLHATPVVVGAVADGPPTATDNRVLRTPAGRAAQLGRGGAGGGAQEPGYGTGNAYADPPGAFGAHAGMPPAPGAANLGALDDAYTFVKPRRRGLWVWRALAIVVVLGLIGGGAYAGYRWTRTQYYIGIDGESVAIFRGINQDLPGVSLSDLYRREDINLSLLPRYQQEEIRKTIPADDLDDAEDRIEAFRHQAELCQLVADAAQDGGTQQETQQPAAQDDGKGTSEQERSPESSTPPQPPQDGQQGGTSTQPQAQPVAHTADTTGGTGPAATTTTATATATAGPGVVTQLLDVVQSTLGTTTSPSPGTTDPSTPTPDPSGKAGQESEPGTESTPQETDPLASLSPEDRQLAEQCSQP